MRDWLNKVFRRQTDRFEIESDGDFLSLVSGVIHVGANEGQERDLYARHNLNVLWFEPIPTVFEKLARNILPYPNQRAVQALLTDQERKEYVFHIANNDGASSSILDLKEHLEVWPTVGFIDDITLMSSTLDCEISKLSAANYEGLVLDTQGSELLVLRGGVQTLKRIKFIKVEAADFEAYKDCCQVSDLLNFLRPQGFRLLTKTPFAIAPSGGKYYDLVLRR